MVNPFGLKLKITITVSVLVVALMSAVAYLSVSSLEKQLKATIAQSQFVMVSGLANEIDKKILAAQSQLLDAAKRVPLSILADPDLAQRHLDSLTGLHLIFEKDVLILTPSGRILAESPYRPKRRGFDASFRFFFKDTVATGAPVISDPYLSTLGNKHPDIIMTAPLFDTDNALVGILLGAMDLMGENILQDLSRITVGRTGYLYLTTRQSRTIIMHPDAKRIMQPVQPGVNLLYDKAVNGFEGTGETVNSYGVPMLSSIKHLKVNGWILAANYPLAEAHEILFELEKKIVAATVLGVICVLIIVFYLIDYVISPLLVFTRHVESLPGKSGEDRMLDITTNDEIGTLSQAFNRMVGELDRQKEALLQSEEQYRTIYDSASDAIFIHDLATGAIVDVNTKMCELYGYSREEALRLDVGALSSGESPYTLQDALVWIDKAAQDGPQQFEWRARDKAGRLFWVEIKMRRVRIGAVDRLLVTVGDITDRKRSEEALRESERRLSQIIDFLPDATFAIDTHGKILAWNRAMEEMSGVKALAMLGKGNHEYSLPFYGKRRPILIDLVFIPDQEIERKYSFVRKHGDCILAEADVFVQGAMRNLWGIARPLFDSNGNIVGAIESIRDITESRLVEAEKAALQEKLLQAQKMEAVGTLAGGIAHDFNNILTALIGYGTLLQMKMAPGDPLRTYADQILASSEKAVNLTQNLLAFTRKQVKEMRRHQVNALIHGMERLLKRLLSEDIDFKTILTDEDLTILADSSQIDQVLLNLVTNARDAMPKGGRLIIETRSVVFDDLFIKAHGFGRPGRYALIAVSDTGVGMDEKTRLKIFEPFFTTKEVGKGTGLGLSTVYGNVKQYDGFVTVYSEPGEGTTFHVYLPVVTVPGEEYEHSQAVEVQGGTETILVAEDHEDSRRLIREVLESKGYSVIEAVDGADAVVKFTAYKDQISLLIVDVVMPRKNGMETYNEIKKMQPEIRVLFMSGYTGDIVLDKGIQEKEYNFIAKPLSPNTLLVKVREILEA